MAEPPQPGSPCPHESCQLRTKLQHPLATPTSPHRLSTRNPIACYETRPGGLWSRTSQARMQTSSSEQVCACSESRAAVRRSESAPRRAPCRQLHADAVDYPVTSAPVRKLTCCRLVPCHHQPPLAHARACGPLRVPPASHTGGLDQDTHLHGVIRKHLRAPDNDDVTNHLVCSSAHSTYPTHNQTAGHQRPLSMYVSKAFSSHLIEHGIRHPQTTSPRMLDPNVPMTSVHLEPKIIHFSAADSAPARAYDSLTGVSEGGRQRGPFSD